jgi:DMSO/TMAO reductase YedYZ molybdopterin-dependent catalytic subunit
MKMKQLLLSLIGVTALAARLETRFLGKNLVSGPLFKQFLSLIGVMALAVTLAACAGAATPAPAAPASSTDANVLVVGDGSTQKSYTVEALQALPGAEAAFKDVSYQGVPLAALLQDAGFDPQAAKAVKAIASDGFTVNYGPDLFLLPNTLVAYAQADGPLSAEDGTFRMVLPDQEGKLNLRMLTTLQVVQ